MFPFLIEIKVILQPNDQQGQILLDSYEADPTKHDYKVTIESVRLHIPVSEMSPETYT